MSEKMLTLTTLHIAKTQRGSTILQDVKNAQQDTTQMTHVIL